MITSFTVHLIFTEYTQLVQKPENTGTIQNILPAASTSTVKKVLPGASTSYVKDILPDSTPMTLSSWFHSLSDHDEELHDEESPPKGVFKFICNSFSL